MESPRLIEPLEARIAAAILLSPTEVRYTDVDGDTVSVKFSKGQLDLQRNFTFATAGRGEQLQQISLSEDAAEFSDTNLTITVTRRLGDGVANVGSISAAGVDLGIIRVSGDLGRIEAGDSNFATAGVDFVRVRSLGRFGVLTQAADDAGLASEIAGDVGSFRIHGAMKDASLSVTGGAIGSIVILGSLRGGDGDDSGSIHSSNGITAIEIGNDIIGAAGLRSGSIVSERELGSLVVGGSIESGAGAQSGSIRVGEKIESIVIHGSLLGSAANPVSLTASGIPPSAATDDATAIGRLWVAGNVTFAKVMAGYDSSGSAINGDAQIGRIVVGGNWLASSAIAGALAGLDGSFGTVDDVIQFPHFGAIIASIAAIKVGGIARGTMGSAGDHFGFVAEEIGIVTIGTKILGLSPGASNDRDPADPALAIGTTGDFRVVEVSPIAPPPHLLAAVSRKIHGASGAFDIDLLPAGSPGIESRATDSLTLVFSFDHDLSSGSVSIASGAGTVTGTPVFDGYQMIVNIGNVTDVQTLVVILSAVTDTLGGVLETISIPIAILRADVNGTRAVNIQDVNTVRAATVPGTIDATNFRTDVDLSGLVDAADVSATRASSGNHLD